MKPIVQFLCLPDKSSLCPIHLRAAIVSFLHLRLGLPSGIFPLGVTTKTLFLFLVAHMLAARIAHLTFLYFATMLLPPGYRGTFGLP
jgi:biotin transporter BioY